MTTAELIALIKPLLERLRKYMKNKEVFDIVHQIEAHQKELEAKVIEGESEIVRLKTAHAQEIAQLKEEHAAEIAKLNEKDEKMFLHSSKRSELETQILLLLAKIVRLKPSKSVWRRDKVLQPTNTTWTKCAALISSSSLLDIISKPTGTLPT